MKNMKLKMGILLVVGLLVTSGAIIYWKGMGASTPLTAEGKQELTLARPTFLSSIGATATTLDQEAGMSIWLNATSASPLNLDVAKDKMNNNLENVTSDYVIGSIPLPDCQSDDYPHCFVHKSGWIIVYFLNINTQNPSTTGWLGKMMNLSDANYYVKGNLKNNILQKGLETICSGLGQQVLDTSVAKYYNFQYPNAAHLMIAIKEAGNGQTVTFNIQIPSGFTIDERSWAFYSSAPRGANTFNIDANQIYHSFGRAYGGTEITPSMLPADGSDHTVTVTAVYDSYYSNWVRGCILILYY